MIGQVEQISFALATAVFDSLKNKLTGMPAHLLFEKSGVVLA
jgi:hypothetical protein